MLIKTTMPKTVQGEHRGYLATVVLGLAHDDRGSKASRGAVKPELNLESGGLIGEFLFQSKIDLDFFGRASTTILDLSKGYVTYIRPESAQEKLETSNISGSLACCPE
jgi:hypothetical protein